MEIRYLPVLGKTLTSVERMTVSDGNDVIRFHTQDQEWEMLHYQDCCESVYIEDIEGNLDDLVGEPLLTAEEVTSERDEEGGLQMWTFYKFATVKGYVTIRWNGCSNGWYSVSVSFEEV